MHTALRMEVIAVIRCCPVVNLKWTFRALFQGLGLTLSMGPKYLCMGPNFCFAPPPISKYIGLKFSCAKRTFFSLPTSNYRPGKYPGPEKGPGSNFVGRPQLFMHGHQFLFPPPPSPHKFEIHCPKFSCAKRNFFPLPTSKLNYRPGKDPGPGKMPGSNFVGGPQIFMLEPQILFRPPPYF